MSELPDIKPCPFCGCEAEWDEIELGIFALCCSVCNVIGPHCDGEQDHEIAAKAWNCRGTQDWEREWPAHEGEDP